MSFIRLPDDGVIQSTLEAANRAPADAIAQKARKELLKSISWSFDSLTAAEKTLAQQTYQAGAPARNLSVDVTAMRAGGAVSDADVRRAANAISAAGGKGRHTGADHRYRGMQAAELGQFNLILSRFKVYLDEMTAGTRDGLLDETFPNPSWLPGAQWVTRNQVKTTFQYGYDIVRAWYTDHANRDTRIRIDTYLDPQGAGATSSPAGLLLAESFFAQPFDKQVYTLVHESTHAIQDAGYVTSDAGGYIGELRWFDASLEVRQLNASHFQYVIERIQGRAAAVRPVGVGAAGAAGGVESTAAEILGKAWISALNQYAELYRYAHNRHPTQQERDRARELGKLLGIPVGKTGAGQAPIVSSFDLAAAEHRVARIGVMFGGGGLVHQVIEAAAAQPNVGGVPVALTVDEVLTRVIARGGGPIRKTRNHEKTLEMIKTLAFLCHQNRRPGGPTEAQQWDRVRQFNGRQF